MPSENLDHNQPEPMLDLAPERTLESSPETTERKTVAEVLEAVEHVDAEAISTTEAAYAQAPMRDVNASGLEDALSRPVVPAPTIAARSWSVCIVKARVDAFNQADLCRELQNLSEAGVKRIALDLRANRFLNFQALRFCVDFAASLANAGGEFALIGCQQKTKRHFEIYGSLKNIRVVRRPEDLEGPSDTESRS